MVNFDDFGNLNYINDLYIQDTKNEIAGLGRYSLLVISLKGGIYMRPGRTQTGMKFLQPFT